MVELQKLLFAPPFPNILFTGEKNKTFRVTGGERYKIGEMVSFCYVSGEEFARARIIDKLRKRFETLTEIDWEGHERFSSEQEMYQTYSNWQRFQVGPKTELNILVYDNFHMTGKLPSEVSQPKCKDIRIQPGSDYEFDMGQARRDLTAAEKSSARDIARRASALIQEL